MAVTQTVLKFVPKTDPGADPRSLRIYLIPEGSSESIELYKVSTSNTSNLCYL